MHLRLPLLFISLIAISLCSAQVFPPMGARLNYTQVMFEYGAIKGASGYIVQVAEDKPGSSFQTALEQHDSTTATLITNLDFGKRYQWRYAGIKQAQVMQWNGPYNFEIDEDSFIHKGIISLAVTTNDTVANEGGLIVNDCTHTITDRNGKMVWYLTNVNWFFKRTEYTKTIGDVRTTIKNVDIKPGIYDLRLNNSGTITMLEDSFPTERDLGNNVLWKAPNNGKVSGIFGESYNHDFKHLPNGHFIVLGNELWKPLPDSIDSVMLLKKYPDARFFNGRRYAAAEFGTVIEYDKKGNIVWSWNSQSYFENDPLKPKLRNSKIELEFKPHINAFSVDKKNEYVYVGFRDIDRIVKVEKSTGKVVDSWGLKTAAGGASHPVAFHQQHDANIMNDETIAIFNNNNYQRHDSLPNVLLISQAPGDSGKVIWQYTCNLDSADRLMSRNGGNVDELPNGNLLVCTGNLDRIFEITRNKKIVWQAQIKANDYDGAKFYHRLYRAHYISSLYPCYFTIKTDNDTISKKESKFKITIYNKGSESDIYNISVTSQQTKYNMQQTTAPVASNRSVTINVAAGRHISPGTKLQITVTSQTNPGFERKNWVVVAK